MTSSRLIGIVLLVIGVALIVWGFQASESLSSEVAEVVEGAPSDKAIVLWCVGGLLVAVGLVSAARGK